MSDAHAIGATAGSTSQRPRKAGAGVRAHAFVMALLFTCALAVGYLLLPGDVERIAMLERDGKTAEARQFLEQRFRAGDTRQRTLFQLAALYEQAGDLKNARLTLEALAAQRPRDYTTQRQLSQFYHLTHAEQDYIGSLVKLIDLRYTEPVCRELIGLLRRAGRWDEEQAALQKCRLKGYRRPDEMVRLASLIAADGEIREAALLLRQVDDLRRLKAPRERQQLFDLLIEAEQPVEAQRRASRWLRGVRDDTLALSLIGTLMGINRPDLAIELARETSVPGDPVFLAVGEVMVERGQLTAAAAMLRGWLDKASAMTPEVTDRFVGAALGAGDVDIAYAGAQKAGFDRLSVETAGNLTQALDAAAKRTEADAVRKSLRERAIPLGEEAVATPGRPRPPPGPRFTVLDDWRAALWKQLREANKPQQPVAAPKGQSQAKELSILKRMRKVRKFRPLRPGKSKAPTPSSNGLSDFFKSP